MSIGMVTIEIQVGSFVKGILPIRMENGRMFADQFRAEVLEIKKITTPGRLQGHRAYRVDLSTVNNTQPWVIDYRIFSFTFGGIELNHSKWDMNAVDAENQKILKTLRKP